MEWRDEGILISVRQHGEGSAIIEVFTDTHGRHAGLVRGGASRRMAPLLQPGAQLNVEWRARLEEHLGTYTVHPVRSRAADILSDRGALAALGSLSALISLALPEREAHPWLYRRTQELLDALGTDTAWPALYVTWEKALIEEMGFGLDLSSCAASGSTDDLIYVSPKSGRAVSRSGGAQWANQLLPLPTFLKEDTATGVETPDDLRAGLRTTGYFLANWMCPALGREKLPDARARLESVFARFSP
jgi:DNA repair protein RecO (recombination protein O)